MDSGDVSFPVARLAEGDDPAFGIVKTAIIEYTMDGKTYTATGTDRNSSTWHPAGSDTPVSEFTAIRRAS